MEPGTHAGQILQDLKYPARIAEPFDMAASSPRERQRRA